MQRVLNNKNIFDQQESCGLDGGEGIVLIIPGNARKRA